MASPKVYVFLRIDYIHFYKMVTFRLATDYIHGYAVIYALLLFL